MDSNLLHRIFALLMTGQDLKKLREIANLTQKELADKLGTSHPRISDWETGKRKISIAYQKIIYIFFGL